MRRIFQYLVFGLASLALSVQMEAQVELSMHIDAGESNVSEGLFIRTAGFGAYQYGKMRVGGGFQIDLKSPGTNVFTGSVLNLSREFAIKEFPIEVQGFFMYNPFSDLIHESNWGLLAKAGLKHFNFQLGTNFRTYRLTGDAIDATGSANTKVHENWNLMYLVRYNVKPGDSNWNAGITLTDIDYFVINQETNPILYLHGMYKVTPPITLFAEAWYKSAGALNISVNYFGFFFRTGIRWDLDLKK